MAIMKPLPSVTQSIVDTNGKPTKDFYNWLKTVPGSGGSSGGGVSTIPASFISPGVSVASTGNDSTGDGSSSKPWLTIQNAVNQIYAYDWNGQIPIINVGAGSFAPWSVKGLGRGSGGGAPTSGLSRDPYFEVIGAGSASTTINQAIFGRGSAYFGIGSMTINLGAAINGVILDGNSFVVAISDLTFTGTSTANVCWNLNSLSAVYQVGDVTLTGTIGLYYLGSNTANYEFVGAGNVIIKGALSTLADIDILSNMHSFGGTATVSGGSTTSTAYIVSGNSVISGLGTLDTFWADTGQLSTGGRSEGCVTAPSISAKTGIGTGTAALGAGANAYSLPIKLSPAGSPSSTGTVTVKINEFLTLSGTTEGAYVVSLTGGSAAWAAGATTQIASISATGAGVTIVINWSNAGTALSAGQTYNINLIGQT